MRDLQVDVPGASPVSASLHGQAGGTLLALAHGAGGTRTTPQLVRLAESLAAGGRKPAEVEAAVGAAIGEWLAALGL